MVKRPSIPETVQKIDARLERVEQILPTLATAAELREAIAPLVTQAEMREAITEAVAPLATKAEMRAEIREEGERSRRHFDVVAERVEEQNRFLAEGLDVQRERLDREIARHDRDHERLDRRLMRLEADRRRP